MSASLMPAQPNKLCTTWPDSRGKCVRDQSIIPGSGKVMQRHPGMLSGGSSRTVLFKNDG